jgi:hypothetical protein
MPCASRRFASTLRALRCPTLRPALCRNSGLGGALPFEESPPLPQRSSLRPGFYCPNPSTLNRPHPSHSQAHPDFAAWRFIRDALAVLVRLGDPRVVPCFHCAFLLGMPSSTATGSPSAVLTQSFTDDSAFAKSLWLGTPKVAHHPLQTGGGFSRLHWFAFATACRVARLPGGSDRGFPQPTETFTSELSTGSVALPGGRI